MSVRVGPDDGVGKLGQPRQLAAEVGVVHADDVVRQCTCCRWNGIIALIHLGVLIIEGGELAQDLLDVEPFLAQARASGARPPQQ